MSLSSADIGKLLLIVGALIALAGGLMLLLGKLPFGQLPGDISGSRGSFSFAIPLGTSLLISLVLSVALSIFFFLRH